MSRSYDVLIVPDIKNPYVANLEDPAIYLDRYALKRPPRIIKLFELKNSWFGDRISSARYLDQATPHPGNHIEIICYYDAIKIERNAYYLIVSHNKDVRTSIVAEFKRIIISALGKKYEPIVMDDVPASPIYNFAYYELLPYIKYPKKIEPPKRMA